MIKRAINLLLLLLVPVLVGDVFAQTQVTVRQINAVPQSQIDQLMAAGASLTASQVTSGTCGGLLYTGTLCGQTVQFTAVVMSDPLNSGLASINSTTGLPGRTHVFVRDVTADTEGPEGHGIQLVDGSNLGLETLVKGDVIQVVGTVSPFSTTMQLAPTSFTVVGSRNTATDPIFNPIVVTSSDVNQVVGPDGAIQVNWAKLPDIRGNYVRIVGGTILNRVIGSRPDYNVSSDGGASSVSGYDTSLRYRNDRGSSYPSSFNVRTSDFIPPPIGARVNISGFLALPGGTGADPFGLGVPSGVVFAINPMDDSDLVVTESPPAITALTRPTTVPGAAAVTITATVTPDPNRTITAASIVYLTSSNSTETVSTSFSSSDGVYTFVLPTLADGDFVTYWIRARDSQNAESESARYSLRALVGGITKIAHIQETPDGKQGDSPFTGMTVDMNITATVQFADADTDNLVLQDDASGAPWSGIIIERPNSGSGLQPLKAGDVINITRASIWEDYNLTQLDDDGIVFTVVSTGGSPIAPKVITTNVLADRDLAEAYEGMVLEIDNPYVMSTNADAPSGPFGEFSISSDNDATNALRVDDVSTGVSYTGNNPGSVLTVGQRLDYVRGALWYTFSNFKLGPATMSDIGAVINTSIDDSEVPASFTLHQNYPNPFNPTTQIAFDVATSGNVKLEVYDVMGRQVASLVDGAVSVGVHTVTFDARNLSSGMYIYRLTSGATVQSMRMLLMK